ncbi:helix-turn-helix domain-containing protein [Microbacterium sp. GXS0129]|uniref:helix-turn-helix domain-containing protein n=1 Tax=Microbacterium sp. GXS0129 TaxID=3377836 RepID=UPI00383AB974
MTENGGLDLASEIDQNIGRNMRAQREQLGISQSELARQLTDIGIAGMHQTTIARIESGSRSLRAAEAIAVARVLNVSIDQLAQSKELVRMRWWVTILMERVARFHESARQLVQERVLVASQMDIRFPLDADRIFIREQLAKAGVDMAAYEAVEGALNRSDPLEILRNVYAAEAAQTSPTAREALTHSPSRTEDATRLEVRLHDADL